MFIGFPPREASDGRLETSELWTSRSYNREGAGAGVGPGGGTGTARGAGAGGWPELKVTPLPGGAAAGLEEYLGAPAAVAPGISLENSAP